MKKIITVSYQRVVNLGNYESARIQAGIEKEIEPDNNAANQELFNDLFAECEDFVLNEIEIVKQ